MFLGLGLVLQNDKPVGGGAPPDVQPHSFQLTAANVSDVLIGYNPAFSGGSISREPLDSVALEIFYMRTDNSKIEVQFDGLVLSIVAGKVPVINGTPVNVTTDWTEGMGKTALEGDGFTLVDGVTYNITWQ